MKSVAANPVNPVNPVKQSFRTGFTGNDAIRVLANGSSNGFSDRIDKIDRIY